jgi:hypothetical protein
VVRGGDEVANLHEKRQLTTFNVLRYCPPLRGKDGDLEEEAAGVQIVSSLL